MKKLAIAILFLLCAGGAGAQTLTTVTGVVTDPQGFIYTGARVTVTLQGTTGTVSTTPCPGNNLSPGCTLSLPSPFYTDQYTGKFTINLWANASIDCHPNSCLGTTTYSFKVDAYSAQVNPTLGTGPQSFTLTNVIVGGATQDLSASLSAIAPSLTNIRGGASNSFSSLTAGTNSNTGTFSFSGNTFNLSLVGAFVPPSGYAGFCQLAGSVSGDYCGFAGGVLQELTPGFVPNEQTGPYTIQSSDRGGNVYYTGSSASSVAWTQPDAGSAGFTGNFWERVCNSGTGGGSVVLSRQTSSHIFQGGTSGTSVSITPGLCFDINTRANGTDWNAETFASSPSGATNTLQTNAGGGSFGSATNWTFSGTLGNILGTQAGSFSANTNDIFKVEINAGGGAGACPEQTIIGGAHVLSAITGCTTTPAAFGGLGFTAAVSGYADLEGTSGGQFTHPESVGLWGPVYVGVNNGRVENSVQFISKSGITGALGYGLEDSIYANNSGDVGAGILLDWNTIAQPTNFPAIELLSGLGGGETFSEGIVFNTNSVSTNSSIYATGIGSAVTLHPYTSGNSRQSQAITFRPTNSSGVEKYVQMFGTVDANGNPVIGLSQYNQGLLTGYAGMIEYPAYTVATLPSASSVPAGSTVVVTDATTFTVGTCTGGGSDTMLAVSNGTSWSCH